MTSCQFGSWKQVLTDYESSFRAKSRHFFEKVYMYVIYIYLPISFCYSNFAT